MLRSQLHGLNVIALLSHTSIDFESIMMTGYPLKLFGRDNRNRCSRFLRKYFGSRKLRTDVSQALTSLEAASAD